MGAPTIANIFSERVVVGVGDIAASNSPAMTLSTYALGSCVGIVAYDASIHVAGLLHFMLPDSTLTPAKAASQPCMFADTGIARLLRELRSLRADRSRLRIFLAGGASVLKGPDMFQIGQRNIERAREILRREGLRVCGEHLGGLNNRTLHFNISTGQLDIKLPGQTLQRKIS